MMAAAQRSQASLHFCHNPHAASLLQGLQELRSDSLLVDVILCVSGKEIPCHRNVLAACSGYFREMFCNGHRESKKPKVTIHDVSTKTLQLLVDYAYTSKVTITEENAVKLLEGANFFQIQPVQDACVKFISDHLNAKNCLKMVHVGSMLSSPILEERARLCAMKQFAAVSKTPEFLYLTKDQLITLISSDDLYASEAWVYWAVMTWINHDPRKRNREMRQLMELVRFPFMDRLYFIENVETSKAIRKSCQDVMTETRRYQLFPGEVQSPRTRPRRASGLREAMVVIGGIEKMVTKNGVKTPVFSQSITMTYSAKPSSTSLTHMATLNQPSSFVAAVLGINDIIVSCGLDAWLYQSELNCWSTLALKNKVQYNHKLAVLHGKVYAIGGRITSSTAVRAVDVYDRSQNKWTEGVSLPEARYLHAAAVLDGNIYVMGGYNAGHKPTSTVYRFSPGDVQWQSLTEMPRAAKNITASVLNGCIYVAGIPSTVLCFKPGEYDGSWSSVATPGVKPSCGMTVFGGKIYIYGGFKNNCGSPEVLCLDPESHSLTRVGTMSKSRYAHTCVTILKYCSVLDYTKPLPGNHTVVEEK